MESTAAVAKSVTAAPEAGRPSPSPVRVSPTQPAPSPLAHCIVTAPGGQVPPVSVVILTLNEEANIRPCLESCAWCDDVYVLDSGSTDRTCEIAREMGATVYTNPFKSFGQQRNWAIENIPCKHPWHFHLDADERFTPELVQEMYRELGADGSRSSRDCYMVPNKMIFLGKWLKRSGGYPAYQVRLFHPQRCSFVDFGHGQREKCSGNVGRMTQPYTHYNFAKGLAEWFYKHNGYSDRESTEAVAIRQRRMPWAELRSQDAVGRRRALKDLSYFLRGRAVWRFFHIYFLRLGFLDGIAGFHYCAMIAMYEYWIELKIRERERPWRGTNDGLVHQLLREGR